MSKTTKTSSTTTTTPTNPAQVTNGLTGFADKITNLQTMDPYSFTTGPDALQSQAAATAAGLGAGLPAATSAGQGDVAHAADMTSYIMNGRAPQMTAASMTASTANPYIQSYMDPYLNDVVKSSLAGYDQNAGYQLAQGRLGQAQDDTFGGSGGAIQQALLQSQQGIGRAQLDSQLRSQGFNTALQYANEDANRAETASQTNAQLAQQAAQVNAQLHAQEQDRRLTAAAQLAQLGQTGQQLALNSDADLRDNVASQMATGDAMRQIQLQHNLAPLTTAASIGGLWGAAPFGLLHGQTENSTSKSTTSDPFGTIANLMSAGGSLAAGLRGLGSKG